MNIYTSTKVAPYVYICTHKITNEFYIGYREANKLPSTEDFPTYRTSSNTVRLKFDEYDWQIIAEFFSGDCAYQYEQKLIYENWKNPLLLNKNCQYNGKDRVKGKGTTGIKFGPQSDETKRNVSKGKLGQKYGPQTDEHKAKRIEALKGKTWEEIYGIDRANEIRAKRKASGRRNKQL